MLVFLVTGVLAAEPQYLPREQGAVAGLRRWGSEVVALTIDAPPCRVDPVARSCTAITVPGLDVVTLVAGDSVRFALGRRGKTALVMREQGEGWESLVLPAPDRPSSSQPWLVDRRHRPLALTVSGERLAVSWALVRAKGGDKFATGFGVLLKSGTGWTSATVPGPDFGVPRVLQLAQDRLLVGYHSAYPVTGLHSVDSSGVASRLDKGTLPIKGFALLPDGKVAVARSLADGMTSARVQTIDAENAFDTLVETDSRLESIAAGTDDTVEGIDVDANGLLVVFTGKHGPAVIEAHRLRPLFPKWNLRATNRGTGFVAMADWFILSTDESGLVAVARETGAVSLITIPRPN